MNPSLPPAAREAIRNTIYFRNKRIAGEPQSDRPMHQFEIEEADELCEALTSFFPTSHPANAPQDTTNHDADSLTADISRVIWCLGHRGDDYLGAVKAIRELIVSRIPVAPQDTTAKGEDGRTAQIVAGLPEHTNSQACFEGGRGFWVQTDCVLIERDTPEEAIFEFRHKMANSGHIAVCHNMGTSGIRLALARHAPAYTEEEKQEREDDEKLLQYFADHHEQEYLAECDRINAARAAMVRTPKE